MPPPAAAPWAAAAPRPPSSLENSSRTPAVPCRCACSSCSRISLPLPRRASMMSRTLLVELAEAELLEEAELLAEAEWRWASSAFKVATAVRARAAAASRPACSGGRAGPALLRMRSGCMWFACPPPLVATNSSSKCVVMAGGGALKANCMPGTVKAAPRAASAALSTCTVGAPSRKVFHASARRSIAPRLSLGFTSTSPPSPKAENSPTSQRRRSMRREALPSPCKPCHPTAPNKSRAMVLMAHSPSWATSLGSMESVAGGGKAAAGAGVAVGVCARAAARELTCGWCARGCACAAGAGAPPAGSPLSVS